jgi:Bacterial protein of unknown function (DUF937)
MNLIDLIKNQLPPDLAGKLGGLVGGNEQQAKTGIMAAIPLILAALAKLVSSPEGAGRAAFCSKRAARSSASCWARA